MCEAELAEVAASVTVVVDVELEDDTGVVVVSMEDAGKDEIVAVEVESTVPGFCRVVVMSIVVA